jgi:hypothetical protein
MLKFGRIAVVSTLALALAAATIPTKAEAFGFLLAPVLIGSAFIGAGAYGSGAWAGGGAYGGDAYGAGPYGGGGDWGGCGGCRVWTPPPPPPCCYYGDRWGAGRGGWDRY